MYACYKLQAVHVSQRITVVCFTGTSRQWEVKPPQGAVEEPDSPLKTTLERLLVVLEEKRRRDGRPEDLNVQLITTYLRCYD